MDDSRVKKEAPMDWEEESKGAVQIDQHASTARSTTTQPASFYSGPIVGASEGLVLGDSKLSAELLKEDKPEDYDKLVSWLKDEEVTDEAIQLLTAEGFNSFYALAFVKKEDLEGMGLKKGQIRLILSLAAEAKQNIKEKEFTATDQPEKKVGKTGSERKRKGGGISLSNVSLTCENVSGKVAVVSRTCVVAPGVHTSSYYGPVTAGVAGNVGESSPAANVAHTMEDKTPKSRDFRKWLTSRYVTESTVNMLVSEGFDSFQKLTKIQSDDIADLGIKKAQIRLVEGAVDVLEARKKKKLFPFDKDGKESEEDDDSIQIDNVNLSMKDVTGEVCVIKSEKIYSSGPVYRQDYYGPVKAGVMGNVAKGASIGNIHIHGGGDEDAAESSIPESSPLSDRSLSELAGELGSEWYALGIQLGIPATKLDHLRDDFPHSVHSQVFHSLRLWRSKTYGTVSDRENLKILMACLSSPLVGRNDLAGNLKKKHGLT